MFITGLSVYQHLVDFVIVSKREKFVFSIFLEKYGPTICLSLWRRKAVFPPHNYIFQ